MIIRKEYFVIKKIFNNYVSLTRNNLLSLQLSILHLTFNLANLKGINKTLEEIAVLLDGLLTYKFTSYSFLDIINSKEFLSYISSNTAKNNIRHYNIRALGEVYQIYLLTDKNFKQQSGSYYTPANLIDLSIDELGILKLKNNFTICDPALGCGYFLIQLSERLINTYGNSKARDIVTKSFYGVDIQSYAVNITLICFWLSLSNDKSDFIPPKDNFIVANSLTGNSFLKYLNTGYKNNLLFLSGIDWAKSFPSVKDKGGFDYILSNPPYEVLTTFKKHPENKEYANYLKSSGFYNYSLLGQVNLYKCFIERCYELLNQSGSMALIVPRSFLNDQSNKYLRKYIFSQEIKTSWYIFSGKENIFKKIKQAISIFILTKKVKNVQYLTVFNVNKENNFVKHDYKINNLHNYGIPLINSRQYLLLSWVKKNFTKRLGDYISGYAGDIDQTLFKDCITTEKNSFKLIRGCHIQPFLIDTGFVFGKETYLDLDKFLSKKPLKHQMYKERVLFSRIIQPGIRNINSSLRLLSAILPPGFYTGNSVNCYQVKYDFLSNAFFAGIFNSRFFNWLFSVHSSNNNINIYEMLDLPFIDIYEGNLFQVNVVAQAYLSCEQFTRYIFTDKIPSARLKSEYNFKRSILDEAVEKFIKLPKKMADHLPVVTY